MRAAGCCVSCFARRRIPRHLHIFATEVWWRRGPCCYITAVLGNSYLIRVRRRPSLSTGSPRPSVLLASNDFSFGMAHARRSANPVEEKSELAATPPPPTTRADGKQRLQMRNKITLPRILPLDHNRSHGTASATIASRPKAIAQRKWLRAITPCIPYEAATAPRRASPPSCRPI